MTREDVLEELVRLIQAAPQRPLRIAVDGVDTAGKTTLADELASLLGDTGSSCLRASIDGFHRPRADRYRRGSDSPEGYYMDSFDNDAIASELLRPLGPGGSRTGRMRVFDHRVDAPTDETPRRFPDDTILLFDGVFLQRPELLPFWDLVIFVQVSFDTVLRRAVARDGWMGSEEEIRRKYQSRYILGQRLYLESSHPQHRADVVLANDDPEEAVLLRGGTPQNIYDDPDFFEGYRKLRQDDLGFNAMEQQAVRALLPDLRGLSVLDLGCGFGAFATWACERGAKHVTGVDVSQKMLDAAAQSPCVSYLHAPIEDVSFAPGSFDCIVSSLALHYVADYPSVVARVEQWLTPGGSFVLSVEHPIATAHLQMPGWVQDDEGNNLHFPVDNYADEGPRTQEWFVPGVRKYHRTVATYLNTLVDAGLVIEGVGEPVPSSEAIEERPELAQELGRPPFLVVSSRRPSG